MDLGGGGMGLIFCGKHSILIRRIQVSDPGPKVFNYVLAVLAVVFFVFYSRFLLLFCGLR